MADRRLQIILLLGSRFDFTFEPETFTGKVIRRGVKRGPAPTVWQPCVRCDGVGELRDRFGAVRPCEACGGRRGHMVDPYTGSAVATDELSLGELIERDTRYVRCPDCQDLAGTATGQVHGRQCRRCDGTGRAAVAGSWLSKPTGANERLDGDAEAALVNAIVRRDRLGSYAELERALAGIGRHVNKPDRYLPLTREAARARRLLDELYLPPTTRLEEQLDYRDGWVVDLALGYIDWRMPDPIRVPGAVIENRRVLANHRTLAKRVNGSNGKAIGQRDREILRHLRDGRGVQWVAAEYGLHVSTVYAIVRAKETLREQTG